MSVNWKNIGLFTLLVVMFLVAGFLQGWNVVLQVLNLGLISAIMALGVNMQWGYAGLFNTGVVGFAALGGLAVVLVSSPFDPGAWAAGGWRIPFALMFGAGIIALAGVIWKRLPGGWVSALPILAILIAGFFVFRLFFDPAVAAVESITPAATGNIGGLGLPVLLSWPVGGLLAAGAAWIVAKTALGLRSDYLAIATLGIAEIIIAILKNEDWLDRGVKNVIGLPRPVPYEVDLQQSAAFVDWTTRHGFDLQTASSIVVKLCYTGLFAAVLLVLLLLAQLSLNSPWGRMMRAIRDNEVAAEAMGKDVVRRHLQVFVIGAVLIGVAGAMMTTLEGQLTPASYNPLRFTFLIWVMVIVGGSGNNWGAVLGGLMIWFFWVEVEPMGLWLIDWITVAMPDGPLKAHLIDSAAQMRLPTMGIILLLALRFSPRGLIPEK
ncbi:MAG: branched-chain amino acid ABC transporter permease [Nitratireductor sp.]|nr:branched-chain amino acid ABC transporter permease [Nitratireductor sp.]